MLRAYLRALREPRYARLAALMVLVALACIGAGTWQIVRFEDKVSENDAITANAHSTAAPVAQILPLAGGHVSADAIEYRNVTATGRYDEARTQLVRERNVDGQDGSLVLTPFVTRGGVLLVVRGLFHPIGNAATPAAPRGRVTISGRVQPSETNLDGTLNPTATSVRSINADAQQHRLGARVYDGYVALGSGQPGGRYLLAIPPPDLSNPAGGAVEPQHFAYIIQWYLFALLALAAPFAMMRADRKERPPTTPPATETAPVTAVSDDERRAAKLADRYGR